MIRTILTSLVALAFLSAAMPTAAANTVPCDKPEDSPIRDICYSLPWTVAWTVVRDVVLKTFMDVYCPGQPECEILP